MKLKKYIILPILLMVLLTGCSGTNFNNHMQKGKDAVASRNYDEAKSQFTMALEVKSRDKEAIALNMQVEKLMEALDIAKANNFDSAMKKCDDVLDIESESNVIKTHASEYKKQYSSDIKKIRDLKIDLQEKILGISGAFYEEKYEECIASVDEILVKVEGYEIALASQKEELEKIKYDSLEAVKQIEEARLAEEKRKEDEERKAKEETERLSKQKSELEKNGKLYEKQVYELIDKDTQDKSNYKIVSKDMGRSLAEDFYKRWDVLLNDIFNYLGKTLDKADMDNLKIEEEKWVETKIRAGKLAALEARNEDKAYINDKKVQGMETRRRCIVLLNAHMYTNINIK